MQKLDAATLGVDDLPEHIRDRIVAHASSLLELRVGECLAQGLTDEQLDEFDALRGAGDEDATSAWLTSTVPDYQRVVRRESELLLAQFEQDRFSLIAAVTSQHEQQLTEHSAPLRNALQRLEVTARPNQVNDTVQFEAGGLLMAAVPYPDDPAYLRIVVDVAKQEVDRTSLLERANAITRDVRVVKAVITEPGEVLLTAEAYVGDPTECPTTEQYAQLIPRLIDLLHHAASSLTEADPALAST
jgi:hypothetical protein